MLVPYDPFQRPTFGSAVFYKDPLTALEWLAQAFGFERSMLITNADGSLAHAQMTFGDGYIMVGSEWASYVVRTETSIGDALEKLALNDEALDAYSARARAAGAAIVREPNDEFYGDRVYSARDPEGHVWTFGQLVRIVSRAEAEEASGLTIDSPGWK